MALLPPVSFVSLANFCPDLRYTRKALQRIEPTLCYPPHLVRLDAKDRKDDPFQASFLPFSSRHVAIKIVDENSVESRSFKRKKCWTNTV